MTSRQKPGSPAGRVVPPPSLGHGALSALLQRALLSINSRQWSSVEQVVPSSWVTQDFAWPDVAGRRVAGSLSGVYGSQNHSRGGGWLFSSPFSHKGCTLQQTVLGLMVVSSNGSLLECLSKGAPFRGEGNVGEAAGSNCCVRSSGPWLAGKRVGAASRLLQPKAGVVAALSQP